MWRQGDVYVAAAKKVPAGAKLLPHCKLECWAFLYAPPDFTHELVGSSVALLPLTICSWSTN